jgi:integrase
MSTDAVTPIPFAQFRDRILALYAPPQRAKATYGGMRHALALVAELVGPDATTAVLNTDLIARFIATRPPGQSNTTTLGQIRSISAACTIAAAEGWIRISPFMVRKRWIRAAKPKPKKHHSREEIARVLDLMRRDIPRKKGWARWRAWRLYGLASTVAFTGLRKMEALRLKVEDIDLEARVLLVVPRSGSDLKTEASAAPVPIPDALVTVLQQWLPHTQCEWAFPNSTHSGPWVGGSTGYRPLDRMKRLGVRAGVEGFTFLSLRHSFATHAEFWGLSETMIQRILSETMIQRILRHTTTRTQQHYRHADLANMRGQVSGIDFGEAPEAEGPRP